MATRVVEGKKPYTGGKAISIDENKVISLNLRDENNLIIYDSGDDEIYVDLQLPDGIEPTDAFPVGITTGRVLVADDWDITGTIICAKTTSGDNIKILYGDDGTLWMDNGTGTFKQIYFKADVDAIAQAIWSYIYDNTAKIFHFQSWTTSDAQEVYDWISEGKYAIVNCSYSSIPMQNNIFAPTNVTNGTINSLTNQSVTQGIGGTFYESEQGISMIVADGVVTNVNGFGTIINDDGRVIIASSSTPSSYTIGTTWYDTTNNVLKIYDGTSWNLVGGGSGTGDVVGPNSATDGHLAVFDGATGKIIKDGGAIPTGFEPDNAGSTDQVLTKTANGYEWAAPTEPTVVSGDSGVTYTIKVSNSNPTSGTASNIVTLVP